MEIRGGLQEVLGGGVPGNHVLDYSVYEAIVSDSNSMEQQIGEQPTQSHGWTNETELLRAWSAQQPATQWTPGVFRD